MRIDTSLTQEQIDLIKQTICKEGTDADLMLFINVCNRTKLDPFARQIYATFRNSKQPDGTFKKIMTIQVSIDGLRVIASRSGLYQGQTPAQWCDYNGSWFDVWLKSDYPAACKVGVYVQGFREPLYAIARWDSYVQTDYKSGKATNMWHKMSDLMLAKCAESLALRKAFPNDLSGLYTKEELGSTTPPEITHGENNTLLLNPPLDPIPKIKATVVEDIKNLSAHPDYSEDLDIDEINQLNFEGDSNVQTITLEKKENASSNMSLEADKVHREEREAYLRNLLKAKNRTISITAIQKKMYEHFRGKKIHDLKDNELDFLASKI